MKTNTISYHYVNALTNCLKRKGKDVSAILNDCGISACLDAAPRIDADSFIRLMQISITELNDELLGLTLSKVPLKSFTFASHAMISRGDLKSALKLGGDFFQNYLNAYEMDLIVEQGGEDVEFVFTIKNPELDPDHLLAEFLVNGWYRFASWMIGKKIVLKQANFNYPAPQHVAEYQSLFQCPQHFDQNKLSIRFDANYLNEPIVKSNADELQQYLDNSLQNLLFTPIEDESFSFKVRNLLATMDRKQFPTIEDVASNLCMTPRTLRIRLKEEGTNYQQIKEIFRRDTAIYYLNKHKLRISQIAYNSGFNEPSGFTRAFKKWTGLSPSQYRTKQKQSLYVNN